MNIINFNCRSRQCCYLMYISSYSILLISYIISNYYFVDTPIFLFLLLVLGCVFFFGTDWVLFGGTGGTAWFIWRYRRYRGLFGGTSTSRAARAPLVPPRRRARLPSTRAGVKKGYSLLRCRIVNAVIILLL